MRERVRVECAWFLRWLQVPRRRRWQNSARRRELLTALEESAAPMSAAIKQIEARTNHDVKAVELWLRANSRPGREPARTGVDALRCHLRRY